MTLQMTLADGGAGARALLRKAMGTSAGLERRSVKDDLRNHETASFRWHDCTTDARLVHSERDGRTYRCPECGREITEMGENSDSRR